MCRTSGEQLNCGARLRLASASTVERPTKRPPLKLRPARELKRTCFVVLVAAAVFAPTLRYGFVWDDPISIQRWLPALDSVAAVFLPPANIPQFPADYYRPLQLLSYKIDAALGGGAPWVFHCSSVMWHVVVTSLVFLVGSRLWSATATATVASTASAILFAVHPIHSESVAWVAARPDPMVGAFSLAALYLVLTTTQPTFARAAAIGLLTLAALLSKETGAAAIFLLPLAAWLPREELAPAQKQPRHRYTPLWFTAGATAAAGALYVVLRHVGLQHYRGGEVVLPESFVLTLLAATGWYVWTLVWPFPQNAFVAEVPTHPWYVGVALCASVGTALGGLTALKKGQYPIFFSLAWFWCTLAPSLALLAMQPEAPVAERYLYLPSIAFSWLAGQALAQVTLHLSGTKRSAVFALSFLLLAGLGTATLSRNEVWRDNVRLWTDTAAKNPHDGFALRNLAAAFLELGNAEEAERLLHEALRRRNSRAGLYAIHSNLGTVAFLRGQYDEAAEHYRKAFDERATGDAAYNLGIALFKAAEATSKTDPATIQQARQWLERALSLSPYDPEIHYGYAEIVGLLGDHDLASRHFRRALELGLREPQATRARSFLSAPP